MCARRTDSHSWFVGTLKTCAHSSPLPFFLHYCWTKTQQKLQRSPPNKARLNVTYLQQPKRKHTTTNAFHKEKKKEKSIEEKKCVQGMLEESWAPIFRRMGSVSAIERYSSVLVFICECRTLHTLVSAIWPELCLVFPTQELLSCSFIVLVGVGNTRTLPLCLGPYCVFSRNIPTRTDLAMQTKHQKQKNCPQGKHKGGPFVPFKGSGGRFFFQFRDNAFGLLTGPFPDEC